MKIVVSCRKCTFFHIASMITLAGMERNWTARGMPAANQIPSPLPRAHPRTQWTVIRSGTTHYFPSKLPPERPPSHSPVLLIRTWFHRHLLASRHRQSRGWRQRGESYGLRYSAQRENPLNCQNCTEVDTFVWERIFACSDRSILVKSGINTTDGLSSYAQYEHRKHTHTQAQALAHTQGHSQMHKCL